MSECPQCGVMPMVPPQDGRCPMCGCEEAFTDEIDIDLMLKAKQATAMTDRDRMTVEGWQPIATAPKMKNILLFAVTDVEGGKVRNWKMGSGYWSEGHASWDWEGRVLKSYDCQPTHWMHLPSPPQERADPIPGCTCNAHLPVFAGRHDASCPIYRKPTPVPTDIDRLVERLRLGIGDLRTLAKAADLIATLTKERDTLREVMRYVSTQPGEIGATARAVLSQSEG